MSETRYGTPVTFPALSIRDNNNNLIIVISAAYSTASRILQDSFNNLNASGHHEEMNRGAATSAATRHRLANGASFRKTPPLSR